MGEGEGEGKCRREGETVREREDNVSGTEDITEQRERFQNC